MTTFQASCWASLRVPNPAVPAAPAGHGPRAAGRLRGRRGLRCSEPCSTSGCETWLPKLGKKWNFSPVGLTLRPGRGLARSVFRWSLGSSPVPRHSSKVSLRTAQRGPSKRCTRIAVSRSPASDPTSGASSRRGRPQARSGFLRPHSAVGCALCQGSQHCQPLRAASFPSGGLGGRASDRPPARLASGDNSTSAFRFEWQGKRCRSWVDYDGGVLQQVGHKPVQ